MKLREIGPCVVYAIMNSRYMKSIYFVGVNITASKKSILVDVLLGEERDRGGEKEKEEKGRIGVKEGEKEEREEGLIIELQKNFRLSGYEGTL